MKMKQLAVGSLLVLGMTASIEAQAHRAWMLPSATVLSGENSWVTVDGAVSNDLFYFEHHPLRLDNLEILSPSGASVAAQNQAQGKYRSVFDLELVEEGTYTLQTRNQGVFGRFTINGEAKRWRGRVDEVDTIPTEAEDVQLSEIDSRMQVFVTKGAPSDANFEPTGQGIELVPVTHPNDLFTGEAIEFRFLVDGQPGGNLAVTLIRGGIRYRDQVGGLNLKTDASGALKFELRDPGMYWLEVETEQHGQLIKGAKRRMSYSATLEVLPL